MGFLELFLLAGALSMDSFAAAICAGLKMKRATVKNSLTVGAYFGIIQGSMPLIGYLAGSLLTNSLATYGHWISFGLLMILGIKTIFEGFRGGGGNSSESEISFRPSKMLPLAIATSIDALAAGISFAFMDIDIMLAALLIGSVTFILSAVGVKIGHAFGISFKSKAELIGGAILILIGIKILLEHYGVF